MPGLSSRFTSLHGRRAHVGGENVLADGGKFITNLHGRRAHVRGWSVRQIQGLPDPAGLRGRKQDTETGDHSDSLWSKSRA